MNFIFSFCAVVFGALVWGFFVLGYCLTFWVAADYFVPWIGPSAFDKANAFRCVLFVMIPFLMITEIGDDLFCRPGLKKLTHAIMITTIGAYVWCSA